MTLDVIYESIFRKLINIADAHIVLALPAMFMNHLYLAKLK